MSSATSLRTGNYLQQLGANEQYITREAGQRAISSNPSCQVILQKDAGLPLRPACCHSIQAITDCCCPNCSFCLQWTLFVTTALVIKQFVLTLNCPYSEGPLQSECSSWSPMALSLDRHCPSFECHYKDSLVYMGRTQCDEYAVVSAHAFMGRHAVSSGYSIGTGKIICNQIQFAMCSN